MADKIRVPDKEAARSSQIGATLEALQATIARRRDATDPNISSYTRRLLTEPADCVLKKVMEEAGEVALAAKDVEGASSDAEADEEVDHLRYEAADVVYHLMVVLARYGISLDELAAELNERMEDGERPVGCVRLAEGHVRRGK